MEAARIDRMRLHYRMPEALLHERPRYDELLRRAVEELLEDSLRDAGVDPREALCIRSLKVPFRLQAGRREEDVQLQFARAVAEAARAALARSDGVVRYPSKAAAWIDFAERAPRGDLSRAWAWRQLGLWRNSVPETVDAAADEVLEALVRDAGTAPRLLVTLLGRRTFGPLARRTTVAAWRRLGQAMLAGYGVTGAAAAGWLELPRALPPMSAPDVSAAPRRTGAFAGKDRPGPFAEPAWDVERALTIEPGARRALARLLPWPRRVLGLAVLLQTMPERVVRGAPEAFSVLAALEAAQATPPRIAPMRQPDVRPARAPTGQERPDAGPIEALADPETVTEATREPDQEVAADIEPPPLEDLRARGRTEHGGLLYLLHVLEELKTADALADALAYRPLRWSLHRLGMTLTGAGEEDPAVLAFCGLGPEAPPPTFGEPPPSREETSALDDVRAQVVRRLRERLREPDLSDARLLHGVLRRPAEIVADPGWLEVRMRLEDVDVRIRRSGLDLDPGFVRWLGVVVRFVYA